MKYVIALDLDGTTLTSTQTITPKTQAVIKRLQDDGHTIIITTGRPYQASIQYYEELNLNTLMINDNGGAISHPNNDYFDAIRFTLKKDLVQTLLHMSEPYLLSAMYTIDDAIYAYRYNQELEKLFNGKLMSEHYEIDKNNITVLPTGMIFMIDKASQIEFEQLVEQLNESIHYRLWGTYHDMAFYEVYQKDISKKSGLEIVLNYYNKTSDDLIAFGDDINDIEMLEFAKVGVKMKNANPRLNGIDIYTTDHTNDEDGVANFLQRFLKI